MSTNISDDQSERTSENKNCTARNSFISTMAHDIRTPMNAIIMTAELAEKHLDDSEYIRECLSNISLAGNYMMTLINNILDISRSESEKSELNPAVFSLSEMINNLKNIFRPQLESQNLITEIFINKIEHDMVIGDRVRISQIMINLASNAVKYTGSDGHITININEETSALNKNTVIFTYSVKDNGKGIPEGFQEQMYNSYSRDSNDSIPGYGLGLSICRRLTELMGGNITCESKVGFGTEFTVTLELDKAYTNDSELPSVSTAELNKTLKGRKVLVAEDNRMNRKVLAGLLEMYGIEAVHAENGQICLDILEASSEGDIDAVLMDVRMPVLNGKETVKIIRQSSGQWFCSIPVIALTADTFSDDIQSCLEAGMDGILSKPVNIDLVLRELYHQFTARRQ